MPVYPWKGVNFAINTCCYKKSGENLHSLLYYFEGGVCGTKAWKRFRKLAI